MYGFSTSLVARLATFSQIRMARVLLVGWQCRPCSASVHRHPYQLRCTIECRCFCLYLVTAVYFCSKDCDEAKLLQCAMAVHLQPVRLSSDHP